MKIAVLVSGGVDSSVALYLLKKHGYDVTAFYLKIWLEDEVAYLGSCPWQEDVSYVEAVCTQLGVPWHVISLQKEYWNEVVTYTIEQARVGRTPNPDILCNTRIKFGFFLKMLEASFDKVATGHYAQVQNIDGHIQLLCSPDLIKDQSYFLSHLTQTQLARVMFPIGHLTKDQVRSIAQEVPLPTKDRKDSQGICFLGKLKFKDFLKHYLGERPGTMIEYETGKILGSHKGYWFYTIGQRQGLGLSRGPWYVVAKDIATNTLSISRDYYALDKKRDAFMVSECNWIPSTPVFPQNVEVKVRHGMQRYKALCTQSVQDNIFVQLHERDQGIAPGQFAVLYNGQQCLGGGVIMHALTQRES